jgi:hypothetical protein
MLRRRLKQWRGVRRPGRADGSVQRSLKEPCTLLVEGIGLRPTVSWNPTEIEFLDCANERNQTFRVASMGFVPPASLKLPLLG